MEHRQWHFNYCLVVVFFIYFNASTLNVTALILISGLFGKNKNNNRHHFEQLARRSKTERKPVLVIRSQRIGPCVKNGAISAGQQAAY